MASAPLSNVTGRWLRRLVPLVAVALVISVAVKCRCASRPKGGRRAGTVELEDASLAVDLKRLDSFKAALEDMAREMERFQATFTPREKGYFSSREHDLIEQLLFRYLMCRESLWEMIDRYRSYRELFTDESRRTRGFLIGYSAALQLYYYSARLVHTFHDEPQVREKLNEAYFRSRIPAGTYDTVFRGVTNPDHLQRMAAAWQIFVGEAARPGSELHRLRSRNPQYRKIIGDIIRDHRTAEQLEKTILDQTSVLLPNVRNALRHSEVAALARSSLQRFGSSLYAIRGLTFTNISRLQNPLKGRIDLIESQLAQIKRLLEPGDVILTFKTGYMSNLFLPGAFKHGLTYVGSPAERRTIGLGELSGTLRPGERERFEANVRHERITGGHPADLIEAVAEGVIFNSIEKIAEDRIGRLVALRPRLSPEQRLKQLTTIFRFLGCGYDFKFDFNDATYQCCTELIYRSLNGVGPVRFGLVPRMGRQTLSADDVCRCAIDPEARAFEVVFLATQAPKRSAGHATILPGSEGLSELGTLLKGAP